MPVITAPITIAERALIAPDVFVFAWRIRDSAAVTLHSTVFSDIDSGRWSQETPPRRW
jgi:hypothetical protein